MKSFHRLKHILISACLAAAWLAAMPGEAAMAVGTDRYVAKTGNDTSNNCSNSLAPCLTVAHAISESVDDDTIHIAAGTYIEHITIADDLTLQGAGMSATILDGGASGRVVNVGVVDTGIKDLTIQNANIGSEGGGIQNLGTLTLERVKIAGNTGYSGGGIATYGPATITDSWISGNTASGGAGGGFFTDGVHTVSLNNVTVSGNTSVTGTGGVHVQGSATLNLTNSTILGTSAGSALTVVVGSTANIVNSTIANNPASGGGVNGYGTLNFTNTIVADNFAYNCFPSAGSTWTSLGHNLDSGTTCTFGSTGDQSDTDPILGEFGFYSGPTPTLPLSPGSPAINGGDDAVCAAAPVNGKDQRGVTRPQGTHCEIGAFEVEPSLTFRSVGTQDGWVLESTETSGSGGSLNAVDTTFNVGDDATDRQYRAILSFNTGPSLPDTAIITSATLKLKKTGVVGGSDPFLTLGNLAVDIKKGPFSSNSALQNTDFKALAGKNYVAKYAGAHTTWISTNIGATGLPYINTTGGTQLRLRFATDDNNNNVANYIKFASGNAITTSRPQLVITYYVP